MPVGAQALLVGQIALEGDVAGVVVGDAHVPLLARCAALTLVHLAVLDQVLGALAPVGVRAGVAGVGQDLVGRLVGRLRPAQREKTLWRLLYETAARAQEILSLDADDLDLANKRARVRSKRRKPGLGVLAYRRRPAAAPPARRPDHGPRLSLRPPPHPGRSNP